MENIQLLRSDIRTPEDSAFKGHYIQAVKRSGMWCLYKHRNYEVGSALGYYLFEARSHPSGELLPKEVLYYKSKSAAYDNYKKKINGINRPVGNKLPDNWPITDNLSLRIIRRMGQFCVAEQYSNRSGYVTAHYAFEIKLNRLGNEQYPKIEDMKKRAFGACITLITTWDNKLKNSIVEIELRKSLEARLKDKLALIKKELVYIRSGKKFTLTFEDIKK